MAIEITELSKMIDHSLLHPTMTQEDLEEGCKLAVKYNVASVCVKPYAVKDAKQILGDANVMLGCVIGFPHGNSFIDIKAQETRQACLDGAVEIDMVINIGKALEMDMEYIKKEIAAVQKEVKANNAALKVIFENDYLNQNIIIELCRICNELQVDFIKTSTGYGFVKQDNGFYSYDGATEKDLKLMVTESDENVQVKAAGGIRSLEDLLFVKSIGVTRIGCTATAAILDHADEMLKSGALESLIPAYLSNEQGY